MRPECAQTASKLGFPKAARSDCSQTRAHARARSHTRTRAHATCRPNSPSVKNAIIHDRQQLRVWVGPSVSAMSAAHCLSAGAGGGKEGGYPLPYRASCTWPCITQTPTPVIAHSVICGRSKRRRGQVSNTGGAWARCRGARGRHARAPETCTLSPKAKREVLHAGMSLPAVTSYRCCGFRWPCAHSRQGRVQRLGGRRKHARRRGTARAADLVARPGRRQDAYGTLRRVLVLRGRRLGLGARCHGAVFKCVPNFGS